MGLDHLCGFCDLALAHQIAVPTGSRMQPFCGQIFFEREQTDIRDQVVAGIVFLVYLHVTGGFTDHRWLSLDETANQTWMHSLLLSIRMCIPRLYLSSLLMMPYSVYINTSRVSSMHLTSSHTHDS